MRRVLLTGATGFVGAAVLRRLRRQDREVAVILRAASDTHRIADLLDQTTVIRGDLSRPDEFRERVRAFGPQVVAHLAWDGVKGAVRNDPAQLDNVVSAIALYRMTAALGCHRFVGLGSQAEYGPQTGRIREDCPTRPTTLYGAAKLATCLMLERAAASSGRGFAWLRLFSTYGPGDDPSWMIPYLIRCLLARERPSLTAAEQVWDYLHVDDAAAAVVAVMDMDPVGVFNLGSGRASPLRDIVTFIRDCIDPALPLGLGEVPYRADQVMHLEADVSALHAATGWAPSVPLQDGLRAVVDDYRRRAPGLPAQ